MQPDDAARIDRLECQVRYLLEHVGIGAEVAAGAGGPAFGAMPTAGPVGYSPGQAVPPQLIAQIQSGKLIQAIKAYRQMTGTGLKEAKDAVEAMARDLGVRR